MLWKSGFVLPIELEEIDSGEVASGLAGPDMDKLSDWGENNSAVREGVGKGGNRDCSHDRWVSMAPILGDGGR